MSQVAGKTISRDDITCTHEFGHDEHPCINSIVGAHKVYLFTIPIDAFSLTPTTFTDWKNSTDVIKPYEIMLYLFIQLLQGDFGKEGKERVEKDAEITIPALSESMTLKDRARKIKYLKEYWYKNWGKNIYIDLLPPQLRPLHVMLSNREDSNYDEDDDEIAACDTEEEKAMELKLSTDPVQTYMEFVFSQDKTRVVEIRLWAFVMDDTIDIDANLKSYFESIPKKLANAKKEKNKSGEVLRWIRMSTESRRFYSP